MRITGLRIHNQHVGVGDTLHGRVLIDKPLDEHPHIEISHAENDFSIEFVGLDYISPSKHQYKYRLVGFNADWIQTTPGQRLVSFTNLPAGTYRFEVKARNADGVWSEKAAILVFNILPPWYQSPWAYLLYTGVLLLALLLYRKVTLHQQKLKNEVHLKEILYQKEKELTDLKLNFFTQVSHELRTPLTLIMGPVEELMQGKTAEMARREQLLLVHRQAQKLNNLVNELLDFRKTESGNAKLQAQRADIVAFLKELFVLFSFRAEEQQINYRFESSHSELFMAFDPAKMETVISNLLSNALKFTPAGETIRLVVTLEQEQHVHIVVEDTGYGIAPEELDRIFDPYYQAHQSGSLPVKGTGIGLALVKSMVALHQGQISVESQPEEGTRFVVALPLCQPEVMVSPPPVFVYEEEVLPHELIPAAGTDFRILIVEDDKDVQQYLQQLLSSYALTVAEHGLQALVLLQDQTFDLVLTDVMMPEMNGIELCKKIRQSPKLAYLPIVMLTARSTVVEELEGLSMGADEYIAKPFKPQVLLARLDGLLQARTRLKEYYHRQILLQPSEVIIPNADKEFLEKAMRIVEDHLMDGDFSVQDLLDAMSMSQSVFYRRMKSITGQSVIEFIRDVRMKRAAQLLATSSYRISEIAYMVGVEDPKNFRKSFQRVYQMSPSDYVRQHREGSFTSSDDTP
ncbi:hypothetical protein BWI97_25600 [Siphonobacter sp. BAB-5405]|nr:ATP-binding protein [Siphonobacter sp. BAB-5405]PMD87881.1 hypothetical protein BWI97_25600 [Siphonobacter sp. BAB-5405]